MVAFFQSLCGVLAKFAFLPREEAFPMCFVPCVGRAVSARDDLVGDVCSWFRCRPTIIVSWPSVVRPVGSPRAMCGGVPCNGIDACSKESEHNLWNSLLDVVVEHLMGPVLLSFLEDTEAARLGSHEPPRSGHPLAVNGELAE